MTDQRDHDKELGGSTASAGESPASDESLARVDVLVVSGTSCCGPGTSPLDQHAYELVRQALAETGIVGEVRTMPMTTAFYGGVARELVAEALTTLNRTGQLPLPAVLVNGRAVAMGMPSLAELKAALQDAHKARTEPASR